MEIKEYTVDCAEMTGRTQAHEYLKKVFSFPDYYGKNLDALHDCLLELPPCRITLVHPWELASLGKYSASLLQVFHDAADEHGKIELV